MGIVPLFLALSATLAAAQTMAGSTPEKGYISHLRFGPGYERPGSTGHEYFRGTGQFPGMERVMRPGLIPGKRENTDWKHTYSLITNYHFDSAAFVPLVGLSMRYDAGDEVENRFAAAPEVGFKYFMNSNTFLYGLLGYQFLLDDIGSLDRLHDNGQFTYGIGLGLTFSY